MATATAPLLPKALNKSETYELLVIYKPVVDGEGEANPAQQLEKQLVEAGGNILHQDKAGRRRLAYPINNSKDGFVVSMIVTLPVASQKDLRRQFKLDDNVLRVNWLVVTPEQIEIIKKGPIGNQRTNNRRR
jgi:small subunit ribosomal protein S6